MTWLRIDDGMVEHPKIEALSDAAFRLHLRTLSYCARWNTDGAVPALKVELWGKPRPIQECLDAGIWHREGDVFMMHDFLEYNPSKADLEMKKVSGAKGGAASAASRKRLAESVASATEDAQAPARDPVPTQPDPSRTRPDPTQPHRAGAREPVEVSEIHKRAYRAFMDQSPGGLIPHAVQEIDGWIQNGIPVEWIEGACEEAGANGGHKPIKYVASIVDRWMREGSMTRGPKPKDQPGVHTADEFAGFGRPHA